MDRTQTELFNSIKENLSGEKALDLPVIMKYITSYSSYEGYEDFIYALGDLAKSYLSDEFKQDFSLSIEVYAFDYFTKLDAIEHLMNRRQYDLAFTGLEKIFEHLNKRHLPLLQDDFGNHRCFTDELQYHLYKDAAKVTDVLNIPIPYDLIYLYHAACLKHTKNYKEALIECEKGLSFDPVSSDLYFLKATCLKQLNRQDDYYEALRLSLYFACTRAAMSRYLLELAFIAHKDNQRAIAHEMCKRSIAYMKSCEAFDLLEETEGLPVTVERLEDYFKQLNFKLEPNPFVIQTANTLIKQYQANGNLEAANEYQTMVNHLTNRKKEGN